MTLSLDPELIGVYSCLLTPLGAGALKLTNPSHQAPARVATIRGSERRQDVGLQQPKTGRLKVFATLGWKLLTQLSALF